MQKGHRASMPSSGTPLSLKLCAFTNWRFSEPSRFGFLWRLHYISTMNELTGHWQLIQPPAPLPSLVVWGGTESSNSQIAQLVPLATGPHPLATQGQSKTCFINTAKHTFILSSLRKFQEF